MDVSKLQLVQQSQAKMNCALTILSLYSLPHKMYKLLAYCQMWQSF